MFSIIKHISEVIELCIECDGTNRRASERASDWKRESRTNIQVMEKRTTDGQRRTRIRCWNWNVLLWTIYGTFRHSLCRGPNHEQVLVKFYFYSLHTNQPTHCARAPVPYHSHSFLFILAARRETLQINIFYLKLRTFV